MNKIPILLSLFLILSFSSVASDGVQLTDDQTCAITKVIATNGATLQPGADPVIYNAPSLKADCDYALFARGMGVCTEGDITWYIKYNFSDGSFIEQKNDGCGDFFGGLPFAQNVVSVEVRNDTGSEGPITFTWWLVEQCDCNINEVTNCNWYLSSQGSANLSPQAHIDIPIQDNCPPTKQEQICTECLPTREEADSTQIDHSTGPIYNYTCNIIPISSSFLPRIGQICVTDQNSVNYVFLKDGQPIEEGDSVSGECEDFMVPIGANGIRLINYQTSGPDISVSWAIAEFCCYDCQRKNSIIPQSILYPKVDIEQFSVTGGPTVIKDGKILSGFNVAPGVQQTMIQVENRGFFTQNDARVKFLGLPQGVTVEITPNTQKIKAHNLGTYQATFTVGADVPSGTYKVVMIAYSDKGVFDTIQMDLIVP